MMVFSSLVLSSVLALSAAAPPEFNHQEPISLDLKDADVKDVITLLGALANVPVSIAPDVTGTVSVQVKDIPYARVLELIGAQNGLAIRFEGGKLVATRSQVPLPATGSAVPAPQADRSLTGPRLSVEAYSAASANAKPLIVLSRGGGANACSRIDFEKAGAYEVALPGSADPTLFTQFGWDPVTRTRFLAVEAPASAPRAFAISDTQSLTFEARANGTTGWATSTQPSTAACRGASARVLGASPPSAEIRMTVAEPGGEPTMSPRHFTTLPSAFSMRSGLMGVRGQHDETVVFGYAAVDGKSVAAVLQVTAIRTDPRDGREYVYSQVSPPDSLRFTPVGKDPALVAVLPGGSIRERSLELRVSILPNP